jgi:zinc/manganese transport system permease protein
VFFLALVATGAGGGDGSLAARSLFGSIFGLARADAVLAAAVAAAIIAGLAAIARPLLFASVDPGVAVSQGVPVGLLGVAFLGLVGLDAAEATQAVGALLLLGLLAAPAGAAHRLTANPYLGLLLAGGFAVGATWLGIVLSYEIPSLPPSTAIIGVATAIYGSSFAVSRPGRALGGELA